jgi:hypothetical protein
MCCPSHNCYAGVAGAAQVRGRQGNHRSTSRLAGDPSTKHTPSTYAFSVLAPAGGSPAGAVRLGCIDHGSTRTPLPFTRGASLRYSPLRWENRKQPSPVTSSHLGVPLPHYGSIELPAFGIHAPSWTFRSTQDLAPPRAWSPPGSMGCLAGPWLKAEVPVSRNRSVPSNLLHHTERSLASYALRASAPAKGPIVPAPPTDMPPQ